MWSDGAVLLRHSTYVNQNLLTRFDSGQVYGLPEDVPDGPCRKTISHVESPELTATSINASPTSSRRYAKPLWGPSATGEMEKFRFNYEGGVDHEGAVSSRPKFADGTFRFVSSSDAATGTVAERAMVVRRNHLLRTSSAVPEAREAAGTAALARRAAARAWVVPLTDASLWEAAVAVAARTGN